MTLADIATRAFSIEDLRRLTKNRLPRALFEQLYDKVMRA